MGSKCPTSHFRVDRLLRVMSLADAVLREGAMPSKQVKIIGFGTETVFKSVEGNGLEISNLKFQGALRASCDVACCCRFEGGAIPPKHLKIVGIEIETVFKSVEGNGLEISDPMFQSAPLAWCHVACCCHFEGCGRYLPNN